MVSESDLGCVCLHNCSRSRWFASSIRVVALIVIGRDAKTGVDCTDDQAVAGAGEGAG